MFWICLLKLLFVTCAADLHTHIHTHKHSHDDMYSHSITRARLEHPRIFSLP